MTTQTKEEKDFYRYPVRDKCHGCGVKKSRCIKMFPDGGEGKDYTARICENRKCLYYTDILKLHTWRIL